MPDGINWLSLLGKVFPPFGAISPWLEEGREFRLPWQPQVEAAPVPPPGLTPRAYGALATLTPEERARLPQPIPEEPLVSQIARRVEEERRAREEAEEALRGIGEVPPRPTQAPPAGFRWAFDSDLNRWVPQFAGLTAQQQAQQELAQQQFEFQRQQAEFARQPEPISPYQQQEFGLLQQQMAQQQAQQQQQYQLQQQQQAQEQAQFQAQLQFQQQQAQAAQEEQERQYTSQLAAQPINWLQYAAYTGEQPVIQPWMQPLGFQETEGALPPGYEVGQPIPGLQLSEGMFKNLPQLRTPSAQLQARWGPTAQAQFLGYRQARTGAAPEETQFRLGSQRAPTGAFGGFSRFR